MIRYRRSRLELLLARFVAIGQEWRSRDDGTVWTVAQVHRLDCVADLRRAGTRICVRFDDLHTDWKWIAHTPRPKETTSS